MLHKTRTKLKKRYYRNRGKRYNFMKGNGFFKSIVLVNIWCKAEHKNSSALRRSIHQMKQLKFNTKYNAPARDIVRSF